jgi:predicted transcriptional regulator
MRQEVAEIAVVAVIAALVVLVLFGIKIQINDKVYTIRVTSAT